MSYKLELAELMVRSGVLLFGDFTLKSGRRSPYFVNTGNYKTGAQMSQLGEIYAQCIQEHFPDGVDVMFGPAYKGIPLAVTAAASLYRLYGCEVNICFNRKEVKDHGEGGTMIGYQPKDGDRVLVIEDVITSGAALRETMPALKACADIDPVGMVISVDRMERGLDDKTAIQGAFEQFGIKTFPIMNVRELIELLHNHPVDGRVVLDDEKREAMENYMKQYCVM